VVVESQGEVEVSYSAACSKELLLGLLTSEILACEKVALDLLRHLSGVWKAECHPSGWRNHDLESSTPFAWLFLVTRPCGVVFRTNRSTDLLSVTSCKVCDDPKWASVIRSTMTKTLTGAGVRERSICVLLSTSSILGTVSTPGFTDIGRTSIIGAMVAVVLSKLVF